LKVFISGIDGYLGWSLAQYLSSIGYEVGGADILFRRKWVQEMGSWSATPIISIEKRISSFEKLFKKKISFWKIDLRQYNLVERVLNKFQPDAIVHFGQCPSAPYSMMDIDHAIFTQTNNITSTLNILYAIKKVCPSSHLVKLGTMGEYGTPNVAIPEGFFDVVYRGRRDRLPFPRQAGSWYHWSKVHDSNNIMFACKIWNLSATDIMQGIVFGTRPDGKSINELLHTRLDFDQAFGTILNRFCCQAVIGEPLSVYGTGHQIRSFMPLKDCMQCLTLAIENPPTSSLYRVFNQFNKLYSLIDLASKIQKVAGKLGLEVKIQKFENPRIESQKHYYNPVCQQLKQLGYRPTITIDEEIIRVLEDLIKYKSRIQKKRNVLLPDIWWSGNKKKLHKLAPGRCGAIYG
jgi:UDP-sulfoquinovose synthase